MTLVAVPVIALPVSKARKQCDDINATACLENFAAAIRWNRIEATACLQRNVRSTQKA